MELVGCVGATRLPVRDRGVMGEQLQKHELDLTFLDSPGVRRDEVRSKLARIDTGSDDPRLFWGRWAESKWGYWWVVAAQSGGAGDAKRVWRVNNLLVAFDEDGTVRSKQLITDENLLWSQLHDDVGREPAVNLTEPEVVALTGNARSMTLSPDGLEILEKRGRFLITPDKVARFSHAGSHHKRERPGITWHTLHFSEKAAFGNKATFCTDAQHLLGVFQYLSQKAPATMKWEKIAALLGVFQTRSEVARSLPTVRKVAGTTDISRLCRFEKSASRTHGTRDWLSYNHL